MRETKARWQWQELTGRESIWNSVEEESTVWWLVRSEEQRQGGVQAHLKVLSLDAWENN